MLRKFLVEKIQELQKEIYWRKSKYLTIEYNSTFELIDLYFTYKRILKRKDGV